jgi:hypothetical protein
VRTVDADVVCKPSSCTYLSTTAWLCRAIRAVTCTVPHCGVTEPCRATLPPHPRPPLARVPARVPATVQASAMIPDSTPPCLTPLVCVPALCTGKGRDTACPHSLPKFVNDDAGRGNYGLCEKCRPPSTAAFQKRTLWSRRKAAGPRAPAKPCVAKVRQQQVQAHTFNLHRGAVLLSPSDLSGLSTQTVAPGSVTFTHPKCTLPLILNKSTRY